MALVKSLTTPNLVALFLPTMAKKNWLPAKLAKVILIPFKIL